MNIIEKNAIKDTERLEKWYERMAEERPLGGDIIVKKDIPYINDGNKRHTFDVYYKKQDERMPVVFEFHGGGFIAGDKKYNMWLGEQLAKQGFMVCIVAYPLAFEKKLIDILKDCYEAMVVAKSELEGLGADLDNIFICGDSAGGFLATYLAAINSDSEIAKSVGIKQSNINIRAVGAISALFYCSKIDTHALFMLRKTLFGKEYKKLPFWRYINPEKEVYKALPPVYALTSKGDFLKGYTFDFIKCLDKHGKVTSLYCYDDKKLEHDFVCLNPELDESREALIKMSDFFKKHIREV